MSDAFDICEFIRAGVLACLDANGSDPITTTYTGYGLVAWDDCCGQLVVSPENIYRSDVFPAELATDERCDLGMLAVTVLVTLVRCVPTPDDRGHPPSAQDLSDAHARIMRDAELVWSAVLAPLPDGWERATVTQVPVGGEGGCIGVETRLTIGVDACLADCGPGTP